MSAPVSVATASARAEGSAVFAKIAVTPSASMVATSSARSAELGEAKVVPAGNLGVRAGRKPHLGYRP